MDGGGFVKTRLRTLVADDEPLVRDRICSLVDADPDLERIGSCGDGASTLERLMDGGIDLLLLDVQMPEMDGFSVLEALRPKPCPIVIFITAYDEYALRAFEQHAVDYLLKPFDRERFEKAIAHAKSILRASHPEAPSAIDELLADLRQKKRLASRFPVKQDGRILFLRPAEIDWIEATGNYVSLHTGGKAHLVREKISEMEDKLDPNQFVRIHRSAIVNVERIQELRPWFHGDYQVLLTNGTELTLSRGRRPALEQLMGRLP